MKKLSLLVYGALLSLSLGVSGCSYFQKEKKIADNWYVKTELKTTSSYTDEDDRKFMMSRVIKENEGFRNLDAQEQMELYYKKYGMDDELKEQAIILFERYQRMNISYGSRLDFYEQLRGWGINPMEELERLNNEKESKRTEEERRTAGWKNRASSARMFMPKERQPYQSPPDYENEDFFGGFTFQE